MWQPKIERRNQLDIIIQQITDWIKGILVSGIMESMKNVFDSVNDQVGHIAADVGQTPGDFLPAVFGMVKSLSESVIMPVAGILLTFIACYELIELIISHNNLASFETWFIWKWIFKTFVAVELITNTFDITMAVFDVSGHIVRQAGGIIQGSTAVDAGSLSSMQSELEAMELGSLFGIYMQIFIVSALMQIMAALIFVIINGKQGTGADGAELPKEPFCTWLPGIFNHGMRGHICGNDTVCSIKQRHSRFPVESDGIYHTPCIHPV